MNVLASTVCAQPLTHTLSLSLSRSHSLLVIQEPAVSYLSAIHI